jgi:two-component system sensor histidine kinase SenX3
VTEGILLAGVALGSALVGALLGAWLVARRRVATAPAAEVAPLDPGVADVLAVLRSAAVVLDDDDRTVRANAAAHAFGLVRGGHLAHAELERLAGDVRRTGIVHDGEYELPRGPLGAGTVVLQVRIARLGPHHVLVLADDRTEARRLEEIRRDFVVNVSHELKTPVGALTLLAETVEHAADEPEAVRRFAVRIRVEATRLATLVKEIIELSRLQVANPLGELQQVDMDAVVADAVDRAATVAGANDVAISHDSAPGAIVYGNRDMLVTALRNLLDNAVSYSDPGSRVTVSVRERDALVDVAVVDSGIGIAPEDQSRVFERFYRVDDARSRETGGTGLGLSIVKHIALEHGGDVVLWSRLGHGSTFTLRLPSASRGEAPGTSVGATAPRPARSSDRTSALTADTGAST